MQRGVSAQAASCRVHQIARVILAQGHGQVRGGDFIVERALIADIAQRAHDFVPIDGAKVGHAVVVAGAVVIMQVQHADALAQQGHAFILRMLAEIGMTHIPACAARHAVHDLAQLLGIGGVHVLHAQGNAAGLGVFVKGGQQRHRAVNQRVLFGRRAGGG